MKIANLISFIGTLTLTASILAVLASLSVVDAQTPTTSDLPATIGNETTSDMGLTNNSLPVRNTSIIYALPPM